MADSSSLIISLEARQAEVAGLLGKLADGIDITPDQYEKAKIAYESIGEVVERSGNPVLANAIVFPQGSFALGTIIKPIDRDDGEFDVDLACRIDASPTTLQPAEAKKLLGDCLRADGIYKSKLEEKSRCWRVHYAGAFHLDVCPLVIVSSSLDAIPDKELEKWIPTSPQNYATWFNQLADSVHSLRASDSVTTEAYVDPFPDANPNKGWLRRVVQLLKRHRDQWRMDVDMKYKEFAPISVILTTLAARCSDLRSSVARPDLIASFGPNCVRL